MSGPTPQPVRNPPHVVDRLVRENLGLVRYLAMKFKSPLGLEELVAAGNVGLVIAARVYDETRGTAFSTCAAWWIRAKIKKAIEDEAGCGKTRQTRTVFWNLRKAHHAVADADGNASSAALAEHLGVSEQAVEDLRMHVIRREVQLDASYSREGEAPISNRLLVDGGPTAEEQLLEDEGGVTAKEDVARALAALPKRERFIVEQHDLLPKKRTLQSIADELGITRERVRQIRLKAVTKMRRALLAYARQQERIPEWCDA